MGKDDIVRRLWADLGPQLEEQGYELVEVEFGPFGARNTLRLFVDRSGGITLDNCQAVSQFLGPVLDAAEYIGGSYVLEVSSPGFERPVRKPKDFERFVGERMRIKTHVPVDGRKQFKGVLAAFRDGLLAIECDGMAHEVHIENIQKANLDR